MAPLTHLLPFPPTPQQEKKDDLRTKCETRTQIVMAEYRHLHDNLVFDMNLAMREFILQQVEYHRKVSRLGRWGSLRDAN